jgi:hypothetical protein
MPTDREKGLLAVMPGVLSLSQPSSDMAHCTAILGRPPRHVNAAWRTDPDESRLSGEKPVCYKYEQVHEGRVRNEYGA